MWDIGKTFFGVATRSWPKRPRPKTVIKKWIKWFWKWLNLLRRRIANVDCGLRRWNIEQQHSLAVVQNVREGLRKCEIWHKSPNLRKRKNSIQIGEFLAKITHLFLWYLFVLKVTKSFRRHYPIIRHQIYLFISCYNSHFPHITKQMRNSPCL